MHFLLLRTLPITFTYSFPLYASLLAQLVKNLPAMWERWIWSLGCEDPLEKGTVTHASILAWRIPWTIAHGVAKSWTWRSKLHFHFSFECHWWALSTIATNPRKGVHKLCNLFQMFIHPNKYQEFHHIKRENEKHFVVTSNLCTPVLYKLATGLLHVFTICSHLLYPYSALLWLAP